jgi:hypothetical protein
MARRKILAQHTAMATPSEGVPLLVAFYFPLLRGRRSMLPLT